MNSSIENIESSGLLYSNKFGIHFVNVIFCLPIPVQNNMARGFAIFSFEEQNSSVG